MVIIMEFSEESFLMLLIMFMNIIENEMNIKL